MLRSFLIALFLVVHVSSAHADVLPYDTLEDFILGLEAASTEEFVSKASVTPSARMLEWRETLLEQNPIHFERWNQKLGRIPGVGFARTSRPWVLEVPQFPAQGIGFRPETGAADRPFESITEFYRSLVDDTMEVFQGRYRATSPELKKPWVDALKKQNQLLYGVGEMKLNLVRGIGFGPQGVDVPKTVIATEPIGFKTAAVLAAEPPKPIASYKEFIALIREGELSELGSRIGALPKNKLKNWVVHLKRTNRKTYRLLIRRLESRPVVGFGHAGEEVLDALPIVDAKAPGRPIGFRPENYDGDCPVEMVLDMLVTKRP